MVNLIGERIQQFREQFGLNQGEFSKEINISQTTISRVESNEKKPSKAVLNAMKVRFAANPEWILTGEGEMFLTADGYIGKGIEMFGDLKMSEGLAKILKDPRYMKFHSMVMAEDMIHTDIDEELAVYLQYILKLCHEGERDRHWVMGQLERALKMWGRGYKERRNKWFVFGPFSFLGT